MRRAYRDQIFGHLEKYDQMLFLMGPRQAGKTTLAKEMIEEWGRGIYLSWDNLGHRKLILEGPDRVAEEAGLEEFLDTPPLIVLDEIQKHPEWKNYLKGLYDTYKGDSKIIVTGSSKLDVFVKGGDSLMGRYFILRIHPLSIGEIVQKKRPPEDREFRSKPAPISSKRLRALLEFGGFPDPFLKGDRSFYNRWRRTRNKQIFQEDLRDLTKIKELSGVETLAYFMREQVGQLVRYSSLSKKIGMVSDKTVREWIEVLKSLHFFFEVRPYSRNLSKSLVKQPKYYLWDWSLCTTQGALVENFVASHLLKAVHFWNDIGLGDYDLYFIRDLQKREVDFLITKEEKPWILVEAKNGSKAISKNLLYFHEALGTRYAFQLALEKKPVEKNAILAKKPAIIPATSFLSQLI